MMVYLSCHIQLGSFCCFCVSFFFLAPRQNGALDMTRDDLNWEEISKFKGSWLSHIEIDGANRWEMSMESPHSMTPVEPPLPSDCQMRIDLRSVRRGRIEEAQHNKDVRSRDDVWYSNDSYPSFFFGFACFGTSRSWRKFRGAMPSYGKRE